VTCPTLRPAAFLDRDGTVIVEREYLSDPAGVILVPGAVEALRTLRDAGFALVIVTNQSGIGRGLYTEADYQTVRLRLDELLAEEGVILDGSWHCPDDPRSGDVPCRKPNTGMHRAAAAALGLDPSRSLFIGDRVGDVLPALEFGGRGILVRTGYGREHEERVPPGTQVVDDLLAAALQFPRSGLGVSGGRDSQGDGAS
jgi:D-glycero-D-manno-heptose 1,7-bisphosphate phosphatase